VSANNSSGRNHSDIFVTHLRPATPSNLSTTPGIAGLSLQWSAGAAMGFQVVQATDSALATNRKVYGIRAMTYQFTPYGLTAGTEYCFAVRAMNGPTASAWSATRCVTPTNHELGVRVMSYNLLTITQDGTAGGAGGTGETIASWNTARKYKAAALVTAQNPDVILVQEGSNYTGSNWNTPRQVDSFASQLGSSYSVAHTQGLPGEPDYVLTGQHVVYRNTTLAAVGDGGHWLLPDSKWAAWQVLRHRSTGATFLVVSIHLTTQSCSTCDSMRRTETDALIDLATTKAAALGGIPIVYGGDVGSVLMSWHPYDAPGVAMKWAHTADAFTASQAMGYTGYSSVNQYRRTPPQGAGSVDRVFGSAGVAMRGWHLAMQLVDGQFVGAIPSDHHPVVTDVSITY